MQPMTMQPTDALTADASQPFTTEDARWDAVSRRDRAADGVFFSAVVTTGVYCRPSCAGRPLRKNVRFYASAAQARQAGFRACKRCHPDRVS
jgi:AraC family transcriptional regulator, regulatory protein of adaptative response / methylated-DNA-[protein]-cysteine methyltransferase